LLENLLAGCSKRLRGEACERIEVWSMGASDRAINASLHYSVMPVL
jgi:hypothetical protein